MRAGGWLGEVAPFALAAQQVDHDGFVPAPRQRRLQVGADEAGAASYQDHGGAIYGSANGGGGSRPSYQPGETAAMSDRPQILR